MENKSKEIIKTLLTVLISVLLVFTVVKAGTITPPSGAGEPSAKFYTLSEIYNFITSNTAAIAGSHDFTFSDVLAGTPRTLTEIYTALANRISAAKVKIGTTYLGVDGTLYGDTDPTKVLTVSGGTYNAANLIQSNIKLDVAFGASGESGTLAPDGTAATTDCLDTKTFYSDNSWLQKTGSIASCSSEGSQSCYATGTYYAGTSKTLSADSETVNAGYYAATTLSGVDADLAVGNIKKDIAIFGKTGTLYGDIDPTKVLTVASANGTYNATNLIQSNIKLGVAFGASGESGTLTPEGLGNAAVADLFNGKTANLTNDWTLDIGTLNLACNITSPGDFDGTANKVPNAYDGGGNGSNRWCITDSGDAAATDILSGKIAWVDGAEITGSIATRTLSADSDTVSAGYYAATTLSGVDADLAVGNIKKDIAIFGKTGTLAPDGTAATTDCLDTKTFYSDNSWLQKTGSIASCSSEGSQSCYATGTYYAGTSKTLSADSETVNAGYYAATTLSGVDADLAVGNIKKDIAIFGITGTLAPDGTAAATDCLDTKTFYSANSWLQKTGSIASCSSEGGNTCYAASGFWTSVAGSNVPGAEGSISFSIPDGYYSGKTCTAVDGDLSAGNIKSGVTILGQLGTYSGTPSYPASGQVTSYPTSIPNWAISTAYTLASKVIDPVDSSYWICNVAHTSGTGTMADDRTAHPTYWLSVTSNNFDDGYYEAGSAMLYSNVTVNGLIVAVTDSNTGLMWNKCLASRSGDTCATGSSVTKSWQAAIAYCENLKLCNDGTYQGSESAGGDCSEHTGELYANWYLPNVKDLFSIVLEEYGAIDGVKSAGAPYINQTVFPNTVSSRSWSSTTFPSTTTTAFYVHFTYGYASYDGKADAYYVRCVRGQ